jgi:hypothetical protein
MQEMPTSAREMMGRGEGNVLGKKLNPINYVNNVTRAALSVRKHTVLRSSRRIPLLRVPDITFKVKTGSFCTERLQNTILKSGVEGLAED